MDARTRWLVIAGVAAVEVALLAALTYAGSGSAMAGIVVRRGAALVEADNQSGVMGSVRVVRVVAPSPSWVVVRLDDNGAPGMPIGKRLVRAGTITAFDIKLDGMGALSDVVWVSLFADGGKPGAFEANMADMTASPDKPFVVDGREVMARIGVMQPGIAARAGTVGVAGARLTAPGAVTVERVVAPGPSWLVVAIADGSAGAGTILGILPVTPGHSTNLVVPLRSAPTGAELEVSLRGDEGKLGRFDWTEDQPYRDGAGSVETLVARP
jgi:hypothetical protein